MLLSILQLGHKLLILGPLLVEQVLQLMDLVFFLAKNKLVVVDVLLQSLHARFCTGRLGLLCFLFLDSFLQLLDDVCLPLTVLRELVQFDSLLVQSCQPSALLQEADLLQEPLVLFSLCLAGLLEPYDKVEILLTQRGLRRGLAYLQLQQPLDLILKTIYREVELPNTDMKPRVLVSKLLRVV